MEQKFKLLSNLEENILHLVSKRDRIPKGKHNFLKLEDEYIEPNLTIEYIESSMIIKLDDNKELIELYKDKFGLELVDIDIINLIIKYIFTCCRILNEELSDMLGIRDMEYHPKNTIRFLDHQYILRKYVDGYGFGITSTTLEMFRNIFLNFIIPYSIKSMMVIYCK